MPPKRSRPDTKPEISSELLCLDEHLTIQHVLGKGTYGTVLQAQRKDTGELVALKQIVFAERFDKETRGGQEGVTNIRELSGRQQHIRLIIIIT
jgi:serine/threonine protein kinase